MGANYTETITYRCYNDCRMEGCPGHTVRFKGKHGGVEIETLNVDGSVKHSSWLMEMGLFDAISHLRWK
jgi:hypothetical protein